MKLEITRYAANQPDASTRQDAATEYVTALSSICLMFTSFEDPRPEAKRYLDEAIAEEIKRICCPSYQHQYCYWDGMIVAIRSAHWIVKSKVLDDHTWGMIGAGSLSEREKQMRSWKEWDRSNGGLA